MADGIKRGDFVLLTRDGGGLVKLDPVVRYRVVEIEYKRDPPDMWTGTLRWEGDFPTAKEVN